MANQLPTFEKSEKSPAADHDWGEASLGAASMTSDELFRGQLAASQAPAFVDVQDTPGDTFRVKQSGVVEVMTGSAKGQLFKPGSAVYDQVLKNLSDVRGNKSKIESVVGSDKVRASLSSPSIAPAVTPGGEIRPLTTQELATKIPLHQKWWFWPTVAVGSLSTVGLAILLWPTGDKS